MSKLFVRVVQLLGYDHACLHDMNRKSQFCIVCGSACHCS